MDTALTSIGLLYLIASNPTIGLFMLLMSVGWTWSIVSHYLNRHQAIEVGIRELVFFYIEIAVWQVMTGRVAHDRIHPLHATTGECPYCVYDVKPVKSLGEFFRFQLIGMSLVLSVLMLKASAIFFGPLIYIGFAFRASDYQQLEMDVRSTYRSSFKQIWLTIALVGVAIFLAKVWLYSEWQDLESWWDSQPLLTLITPVIHPPAFLPFHLTSLSSALLLVTSVVLVDRAMHLLDDQTMSPEQIPRLLRSIRILGRLRMVLSIYTWICVIWVSLPWLRSLHFPPITFEMLPK
ncbi:MAG: hypothetical protein J0L73_19690 [Verrucomicrobia bacterium]|nr:hypothetical protein [Verrucomicrobiota bacterium]